jgi:hypothetical protein
MQTPEQPTAAGGGSQQRRFEQAMLAKRKRDLLKTVREDIGLVSMQIGKWVRANTDLLNSLWVEYGLDQISQADKPHYVYDTPGGLMQVVRFSLRGQVLTLCSLNVKEQSITMRVLADVFVHMLRPLRTARHFTLTNYGPETAATLFKDWRMKVLVDLLQKQLDVINKADLLQKAERAQRSEDRVALQSVKGQMVDSFLAFDTKSSILVEVIKEQCEQIDQATVRNETRIAQVETLVAQVETLVAQMEKQQAEFLCSIDNKLNAFFGRVMELPPRVTANSSGQGEDAGTADKTWV